MNLLAAVENPFDTGEPKRHLDRLLTMMVNEGGSDLHITAGIAPCIRVNGALAPVESQNRLTPIDTETLVRSVLSAAQWDKFEANQELDTAYALAGVSRFRVNVYRQRGAVGAAFRS